MMILSVCTVVGLIFSVLAFCVACFALLQVEAMKRSTHQITYIDPMKQSFSEMNDLTKESLEKSNDPLESLQ